VSKEADDLRTLNRPLTGLKYGGTRLELTTVPMGPVIESAFWLEEQDKKKVPPVVELRWSGLTCIQVDPSVLDIMQPTMGHRFALVGGGFLVIDWSLLNGRPGVPMDESVKLEICTFINAVIRQVYGFIGACVLNFEGSGMDDLTAKATAVHISITCECKEEDWRATLTLREQEVQAVKLSAVSSGTGFESSEGKRVH
jgi:hypothetical protein